MSIDFLTDWKDLPIASNEKKRSFERFYCAIQLK